MSEPERARPSRRIPPVTWLGLVFMVLAFVSHDVWALLAGGALLVFASLQWGRKG